MNAQSKVEASLSSAMAEAFKEIEAATKSSNNPHFKSKYADLGAVIEAVKPALIAHGLFFTQHCHPSEDGVIVETVLGHASGEERSLGKLYVPANKKDAHGFGSALTYARRYSLMTAFGVPAEDDDGNAATKAAPAHQSNGNGRKPDIPFPQGPAKNLTELKSLSRQFWREVDGCGDPDELEPLLQSGAALTKQLSEALPLWWLGGDKDGEPFEGLSTVITRKQLELSNQMADASPLRGG